VNFAFSAEQDELRALTRRILTERAAPGDVDLDLDLWRALAGAGVAGVGLPEAAGGGGAGFLEACVVLEEVGRATAAVPALAVLGLAGPALARFGRADDLAGVASGDRVVTAALHEPVGDVHAPALRVAPEGRAADGSGDRLTGVKVCVPAGTVADAFVVSTTGGLHLVAAGAGGLTVERAETTSGMPEAVVTFDETPARLLADGDGRAWLLDRATAAQCVVMAGVARAALDLTAAYTTQRQQFDRALASFQAVSQRAADARIDVEAIHLTAWQAAWRLDAGLPATTEVAVAKFWAAEAGQRVVHAATHLHGGVGVDRTYPLHRCFLWAKQLELSLGGATASLARLGRLLADEDEPVPGPT
jgi:alkylation response protein AidB-like acyl-CoA dehydrogenase